MRTPLPVTFGYLAFAALAAVIVALGPVVKTPAIASASCRPAVDVVTAWKEALRLAGVPRGSDLPHPEVRVVFESRYYQTAAHQVTRTCGTTEFYYLPIPGDEDGFTVAADVQVYVAPGDCETLHNALVHEFLHVIGMYTNQGDSGRDEAWVRALLPATCR